MTKETAMKHKAHHFFDEKEEVLLALIPLHKWLMIAGSVLIFLVLPLLFIWSSLGIIHTKAFEQSNYFAVPSSLKFTSDLKTDSISPEPVVGNDIH